MSKPDTEFQVECYAGYRADETPRRLIIGGRPVLVISVVDRWATPDYRYFKVEGDDGCAYTLRQRSEDGKWELV